VAGDLIMALLIAAVIVVICASLAFWIIRRPLRQIFDDVHLDRARELFHQQREWLEARFISALSHADPVEGQRWESAQWHDEVVWARDRQTRHLLALVCVHFESSPFEMLALPRHATALFEFRKGRWHVEGKRLDEVRPDEAIGRNRRFEAVAVSPSPPRRVV
jgi:hypothetical protein